MSLGTDLFGLIAGALGLLALFHSVVVSQLPKNKIKELDTILRETENQFYEDMAYGFLSNKTFIAQVKEQLIAYHLEYDKVRSRALGAKSFSAGFVELLKGLSITISALSRQITYLQADIITTSQEARMEMARTGRLQNQYARRAALICPDIVDEPIPASQADSEARPSLRTPPLSKVSEPGQEGRPPCAPKRSRSCPPGASGDDVVVDPWILLARDSELLLTPIERDT
ncbi:hypothetical protein PLICRDRAFT_616320 [Plicaturopsis crispa FD-325 SS-3]|nr:hypothetical protein PLICRDRAFT_616320 [Plicaturopsis crispa FD-325 SS-3]